MTAYTCSLYKERAVTVLCGFIQLVQLCWIHGAKTPCALPDPMICHAVTPVLHCEHKDWPVRKPFTYKGGKGKETTTKSQQVTQHHKTSNLGGRSSTQIGKGTRSHVVVVPRKLPSRLEAVTNADLRKHFFVSCLHAAAFRARACGGGV